MFKFNFSCKDLGILSNIASQDGTKVKAVNTKENNFTLSKIDDRKKRLQEHIEEFLELYDKTDDTFHLETTFVKNEVTNDMLNSTNPYDVKQCIQNYTKIKKIFLSLKFPNLVLKIFKNTSNFLFYSISIFDMKS